MDKQLHEPVYYQVLIKFHKSSGTPKVRFSSPFSDLASLSEVSSRGFIRELLFNPD